MSKFFINRPIVAIVISILMVIIGAITIMGLPVGQFPDIAPPEIRVFAMYPGADAETMERAVATPIEQQVNGVDNMDYMYSLNSTGNSSTALMVDFKLGTDPNMDLILTQSRQQLANGQLPIETNQIRVEVKKALTSPMMLLALYSPNGTYDTKFLTNYAYINLNDPIGRCTASAWPRSSARQYAMRIWVKPDRLATLGVTVKEVVSAVQKQNTVNPAGQVGGEPSVEGQQFTYTVRAQGRLKTPEEFGDIVVRAELRRRRRARARRGLCRAGFAGLQHRHRLNGKPAAILGVYQLPGSNAVEAAKGVRKLMAEIKQKFPCRPGVCGHARYDGGRHGRHRGDRPHPRHRLHPRDPRRVHLPAGLARDADSHARGAGVTGRHLHVVPDLSASPSIPCRCSAWCSRSASSSTMRSSWWRGFSGTSRRVWRRKMPPERRWRNSPARSSASPSSWPRSSCRPSSSRASPASSTSSLRSPSPSPSSSRPSTP